MPKFLIRIVAALLVPLVLANPAFINTDLETGKKMWPSPALFQNQALSNRPLEVGGNPSDETAKINQEAGSVKKFLPAAVSNADIIRQIREPMNREKTLLTQRISALAEEAYAEVSAHLATRRQMIIPADQIHYGPTCEFVVGELLLKLLDAFGWEDRYVRDSEFFDFPEFPIHAFLKIKTVMGRWFIDPTWQEFLPTENRHEHLPKVLILERSECKDSKILDALGLPSEYRRMLTHLVDFNWLEWPTRGVGLVLDVERAA